MKLFIFFLATLCTCVLAQSSLDVQLQQLKGQIELDNSRISRLESQVADLQNISLRQIEIQGELKLFNSLLDNFQTTTKQSFEEIKESTDKRDNRTWETFISPAVAVLIAVGVQQFIQRSRRKSFEERDHRMEELKGKLDKLLERKPP